MPSTKRQMETKEATIEWYNEVEQFGIADISKDEQVLVLGANLVVPVILDHGQSIEFVTEPSQPNVALGVRLKGRHVGDLADRLPAVKRPPETPVESRVPQRVRVE